MSINLACTTSNIAVGDTVSVGDRFRTVSSVSGAFDAVHNVNVYTVGVDSEAHFFTADGGELVVQERDFDATKPTVWVMAGQERITFED